MSAVLISKHIEKLKNKFNITVNEENECLPSIYWLPKMLDFITCFYISMKVNSSVSYRDPTYVDPEVLLMFIVSLMI